MPTQLTDTAIAKARRDVKATGKRRDLADAGQPGLRLRITPAGSTGWVLACRDRAGRMRRFPLGSFPGLGLAQARQKARETHHKVRQDGADPVADRKRERAQAAAARDGIGTLQSLLDQFGRQRGGTLKSWPAYERSIKRVFGPHLAKPLAELTPLALQNTADTYPAQQQAGLAVRCLRAVLGWAAAPSRALVPAELVRITQPATVRRRDRTLSRDELVRLLPALRASRSPYAAAMMLMLLTLCRREEVAGARWGDLDWQAATLAIDATRSKNKRSHVAPLSRQALDLLRARRPEQTDPSALIFTTSAGGPLTGWGRETGRLQTASGTAGWTRHDLRRTGATMLGEMGETPDIIEAALNHANVHSQIAAVYNKSRYRPQVAAALQRLADALDGIEAGGAEIVPLRQPAVA